MTSTEDRFGLGEGSGMERAVFLDRDGTLIEERHYLHDPEQVVVFPGVGEALRGLRRAGFCLFMVTNQSGVGRGYYPLSDVHRVNDRLLRELAPYDVAFAEIYIAPEAPDQPSHGRKPSPEFLFDARDAFGIDLSRSYMVGDKWADLECGWNAGVRRSLLVRTGYGARLEQERGEELKLNRAAVVDDLVQAVAWVLADQ